MENPNLAQILFIVSILAFLLALVLIVPTVLEERRLNRRKSGKQRKWYLPLHRVKRALRKQLNTYFSSGDNKSQFGSSIIL